MKLKKITEEDSLFQMNKNYQIIAQVYEKAKVNLLGFSDVSTSFQLGRLDSNTYSGIVTTVSISSHHELSLGGLA